MSRILLCDDEPAVLFALEEALQAAGHETVSARSGAEALPLLEGVDLVISDLAMPGMDGLALLAEIRKQDSRLPVVILTARGSERVAVQVMKQGAYDYLPKPFAIDELRLVVARAAEVSRLRQTADQLALERVTGRPLIGESPAWRRLLEEVRRAGSREVTVLLRGETGTGKELVAGALHAASPRQGGPCVRFNCAALPAELAEAELFGHARGAFTGAVAARRGFFSQAHGGTLVLDEVGELPAAVQPKLLRALQDGEIQPVGAGRVEKVDVRVIACTHRDLLQRVQQGAFREDLYYRLAVVELVVPPLRERRGDIALLAEAFRQRYAERFALGEVVLSPALIATLEARDWPGNVRELENIIARLLALSEGGEIDVEALTPGQAAGGAGPAAAAPTPAPPPLRDQVATFERGLIERAMAEAGGNQSGAARRLQITRMTLIDKLKRHGLYPRR